MHAEEAKKNRFQVVTIILTAALTVFGTWLVTKYSLKRQLQNALSERNYATTQDLTNFLRQQEVLSAAWLRQQDIQYTNWLHQQDFQFTIWLKQQGILDTKHEAELRQERSDWITKQDTLFEERLKEIRIAQSVSHDYWSKQQQLLYYKERSEQQAEKIKEVIEEMMGLFGITDKARIAYNSILELTDGKERVLALW